MTKRIVLVFIALLLLLAGAVGINTMRHGSRQLEVAAAAPLSVDEKAIAETLSRAVRLQTIASREDPDANGAEFRKLHALLRERFPLVHSRLKLETVNGYSLVYTWPGTDPQAKGVLLLAHQDVVPISPGTEGKWQAGPFSGAIRDGFVWGRGTWDDKGQLVAQLQAVEMLLASGFQPRQTIVLAFGHDEEVTGQRGAVQIARLLQQRGMHFAFALDEGLVIGEGIISGIDRPVAMVGVAEKGYATVRLKASAAPGHSSMPPAPGTSAVGRLAGALHRLDTEQPPAAIRGVAREMFETLAPEMHGLQRVALSNLWLFEPLVRRQLSRVPSTDAMLRTTTAMTLLSAGNKENVLPAAAEATVNFRTLPGDTSDSVMRRVRDKVGEGIEVSLLPGGSEPSPVSHTDVLGYQAIARTLRSQFPGVIVAPSLVMGGTDAHHYQAIADDVYRFLPKRVKPEDVARFHGIDERISTANLAELVRFYHQLLANLNAPAT